jgi:hypothetical protein
MDLNEVTTQLHEIHRKIASAVKAIEGDRGSSPALQAVVKEFERKSQSALADIDEANEPLREHIVELEQAGDSAKAAAGAEDKISEDTRKLVEEAHSDICRLKANTAA